MKRTSLAAFSIVVPLVCASCATQLETSRQDLVLVRPQDGIVFGSILVKNDLPETKQSWGGLLGPLTRAEASSFDYMLELQKHSFLGGPIYTVDLQPNKEHHFAFKLEQGEYCTGQLIPMKTGSHFPGSILRVPLDLCFDVAAGKTEYIGELVVHLPEYLQSGLRTTANVVDDKDNTVSALEKDQDLQLKDPITSLMHER